MLPAVRWTCPECDREFSRARQSHVCVPGCTVDDCFAGRPAFQRAADDAIVDHLGTLGPFHEDAVGVGVFLKARHKLAEVRPKARSLSVALVLPREIDDPRVASRIRVAGDRTVHVIKIVRVDEVDEELKDWLTEAYDAASG